MEVGILEKLERLIRQKPKTIPPEELSETAGEIFARASDWVDSHLIKTPAELEKQPYGLFSFEVKIIRLSLTEKRVKKLLEKPKFRRTADHLNNFFNSQYDEIFNELLEEKNVKRESAEAALIKDRIAKIKKVAPQFIQEETSQDKLIQTCNQLSKERPTVLVIKPFKVST